MKDPAFLFYEKEWKSPNTYDINFSPVPSGTGVYLIILYSEDFVKTEIVYVGSSQNLLQRYIGHSVLRLLRVNNYVRFYFQEEDNYIEREIELIKSIQPIFNYQHNG